MKTESKEMLSDNRIKFTWEDIEKACSAACIDDDNPDNLAEELVNLARKRGVKFKR